MQSAEEFILDYLRESRATLERSLADFEAVSQRFYTSDCILARCRAEKLRELLENVEHVSGASDSTTDTEIITAKIDECGGTVRLCYKLRTNGDRWLIQSVQLECPKCRGVRNNPN